VSTGLYCYAITRGLVGEHLDGLTGIGERPLWLVEHEGLAGVVSEVGLDEFGEDGLRSNLEDLGWLESVAVAHDRATREIAAQAPTAPLRLATVFLGEGSLRARLGEWHATASAALDRIDGREEWSVKAYADPAARTSPEPGTEQPEVDEPGAGRAYLMRRRAATRQQEVRAQEDAEIADRMHAELESASVAGRRLAAQDRRLTGHVGEMVLNGAYLVDRQRAADFRDVAEGMADRHAHVRVEVAGPWPPYSFASLEQP
jgi:hypothetical protein